MGRILKIAIPVLFFFFLLVWERTYLVKLNLRIEEVKKERNRLLTQVHSLRVRQESMESYSRIEKLAMTKLNMLHPESKNIEYVKKGKEK